MRQYGKNRFKRVKPAPEVVDVEKPAEEIEDTEEISNELLDVPTKKKKRTKKIIKPLTDPETGKVNFNKPKDQEE